MIIYLVESGAYIFAFDTAETAAREATRCLSNASKKHTKKSVYTDSGGMQMLDVPQFSVGAIAEFMKSIKVHKKLILRVEDPQDGMESQVTLRKIILER